MRSGSDERRTGTLDRGDAVDADALARPSPETMLVEIGTELDGPVSAFGAAFWRLLAEKAPAMALRVAAKTELRELHYSDRYLVAPLPVRLALAVATSAPGFAKNTKLLLDVSTAVSDSRSGTPFRIQHNWGVDHHARDVIDAMARRASPLALVRRRDKGAMPHGRSLVLHYADRSVRIILDQGFGFWETAKPVGFDFTQSPQNQTEDLATKDFHVKAKSSGKYWGVVAPG